MVTDRYQHLFHHETVAEFLAWAERESLPVIGIDILPGSEPIEAAELPRECALVFGQESVGLSEEMVAGCALVCHITQYGSTRSINVGAAAAVAMYAWTGQHVAFNLK